MKVMVIEDDETFSLVLCSALREAGFEVDNALSGKEGIKGAVWFKPDLILLDYHLGDMTGFDVAVSLRYTQATKSTPFILLSSMAEDPLLNTGFSRNPNCKATILKSRPLSEVISLVQRILSSYPAS